MLISRKVNDPNWVIQPNKLGRTTGFYGHTPKYWSCKKYDFLPNYKLWDHDPVLAEEHAAEQKARHANCKIGRHRSAVGYFCYVSKKKIYTLYYMGNPFRHKLFESYTRNRGVKWV